MVISEIKKAICPYLETKLRRKSTKRREEYASVEWARCPGELKPQIKLTFSSVLDEIT
jgi:hypothetical protein